MNGNGIVFSQHVMEARLAQEKAIARAEALAESAKAKQYAEKDYEMSKM